MWKAGIRLGAVIECSQCGMRSSDGVTVCTNCRCKNYNNNLAAAAEMDIWDAQYILSQKHDHTPELIRIAKRAIRGQLPVKVSVSKCGALVEISLGNSGCGIDFEFAMELLDLLQAAIHQVSASVAKEVEVCSP